VNPPGTRRAAGFRTLELGIFVWWAFTVLHGFYLTNPIRGDVLARLFSPALPATQFAWSHVRAVTLRLFTGHLAVAAVVLAALGVGAGGLRWLGLGPPAAGERRMLAVLFGLALAMLGWLGLGFLGLWVPALAWAACAAGAAGTALPMPRSLRPPPIEPAGPERAGSGWIAVLWLEILAAGVLLAWAHLTPERFYDAQVYHLALPSLFAMQHKVTALPALMHASFPLGMHMIYGWLWLLAGEPAARAWRMWVFAGVVWLLIRLGAREGRPAAGLTAAALFASCPVFLLNASMTSVDVEMCLLIPAACLAAREARRGSERWVVLAGALTGAAYAVKITTVFWLPGLAIASSAVPTSSSTLGLTVAATSVPTSSAMSGLASRNLRVRRLLLFLFSASLWALPWMLRNEAAVGNPVYPYLTTVFSGGRQWDPDKHVRFLEQQSTYAIKHWNELPRLPWLLVSGANSETFIGPALVLLVPLLIIGWLAAPGGRRGPPGVYGAVGGLAVLLWIGLTHIHRFLLPTWALLSVAAAWSLWDLDPERRWHRRAGLAVALAAGAANLAAAGVLIRLNLDPADLAAGRESPPAYLERRMLNSYYALTAPEVCHLTVHDRILMIGETRGLYWPAPFRNHSVYDVSAFEEAIRPARDGAEAARHLRQAGATHLFVNDRETSRMKYRFSYPLLVLTPANLAVITDLWRGWIDPVLDNGAHAVLVRLRRTARAGPGGPPLPLSFTPDALRNEFEGVTQITWTGDARISVKKVAE